eukprot:comp22111_c0_seq1/m.32307 comp22111_c0_seq1/g.32307  ORF comp22111_c0_seq1/g.32307 comp22111_c0_seq1/m.32307 type:complete len:276 (-) comp22111_c0_seq1:251-1078(-)
MQSPQGSDRCPCCGNTLPFPAFAAGLLFRSKVSRAVLIVSLIYIQRVVRRLRGVATTGLCPHHLFATAVILGSKYVEDTCPGLSYWATWSGLDARHLGKLEVFVLNLLDFEVSFGPHEFDSWAGQIFGTGAEPQRSEADSLLLFLSAVRNVTEDEGQHGLATVLRKHSAPSLPVVPTPLPRVMPADASPVSLCSEWPSPTAPGVVSNDSHMTLSQLPTPPRTVRAVSGPVRVRGRSLSGDYRVLPYPRQEGVATFRPVPAHKPTANMLPMQMLLQ